MSFVAFSTKAQFIMFVRASRDCTNKMYFFIKSIYFVALLCNWSTDPMNSSSLWKQPFSTWNYTERCFCRKVVVSFSFPLSRSEALSQSLLMTLRPTHCDSLLLFMTSLSQVTLVLLKNKSGHESRFHGLCSARNSDVMGWFATGLDANVLFSYPGCHLYENSTVAFEQRTSSPLLFKYYIFISEDLRQAETLIFLITKVNSVSLFMCFASYSLRLSCDCLSVFTNRHIWTFSARNFGATASGKKKYYMNFGRNVVCRQNIFFIHAQLYSDHTGEKNHSFSFIKKRTVFKWSLSVE